MTSYSFEMQRQALMHPALESEPIIYRRQTISGGCSPCRQTSPNQNTATAQATINSTSPATQHQHQQQQSSQSQQSQMDSTFSYELPMDWRPSGATFDYQPYPSPAPSFVSRPHPAHAHHSSSSVSAATNPASPTLSSTTTTSSHGPGHGHGHGHGHSHSHSHSGPIDPSLQDSTMAYGGWSHQQQQQQQQQSSQQPQSPHSTHQSPTGNANGIPYATPPPSAKPVSTMTRQELEQELGRLRTRVNELEVIHHWLELKGMRLEADVQHHARLPQPVSTPSHSHSHSHSISSLPLAPPPLTSSPVNVNDQQIFPGGVAPTEEFASSWRSRTEARIKRFCALNRAGNALCAWHDSRRERRAYPPRQAPPGYLNCGCTNEEALFEESLARHGVGSYHPGEMVRMDPALRNPLLKLLESRFGYVDGDFERDCATGLWNDGEGHELWENILPSGKPPVSGGRKRGDTK